MPLIVDTDIFTNTDDVGALASAFALQLRGEAKVIAVAMNTRTSRPAVATNSWKCVAAIDNFYGFPDIPIGSHFPDNGTTVNTPDFVGPCAQLAPASTPAPDTAVNVYRRALASQADGSVVVACIGYEGNLADLLRSSPDAISPLSGRDLVAQKVRTLVVMGGGYPSRMQENNLAGDPASAQFVSANWPTKIVWSGYEVGDAVHTGNTITSTHPADSPVRVAYEAFVGPNNWIPSYDLTAVYLAVRPTDPLLSEVGPGTNAIDSHGGNVFTMGTGSQYYLTLSNATALDGSIETLLDTLPPGQIKGTVVDASTHRAIAGALVEAYTAAGSQAAHAQTAPDGTYTLSGLPAGTYKVGFVPNSNYLPQFYSGKSTLATADPVSVATGSTSTGVDAALAVVPPSNTGAPGTSGAGSTSTGVNAATAVVPPSNTAAPAISGSAEQAASVSSATIRALLLKALAAGGSGARIGALLKRGGYSFSFAAPSPGRLVISWYHTARHGRTVLVAGVTVAFRNAIAARCRLMLTRKGRTLLNSTRVVKLTAKGSFTPVSQATTSATKTLTLKARA
jgi:inosine-uridine nucleoside N-ribohydrolase